MSHVTFDVDGTPAPQGSKTAVARGGRAWVIEGGSQTGRDRHKKWRDAVYGAALQRRQTSGMAERPVDVSLCFRMPLPASYPKWKAGTPHRVKPDLDKLIRSTLDGLADGGVLPGGDSRVYAVSAVAHYVEDGETAGVTVDVWYGPSVTRDNPQRAAR